MTKSHPLTIGKAIIPVDSFKDRVRSEMINSAADYKYNFIDCEYLVCSDAFNDKKFFIIDGNDENYKHLTGVNSSLDAITFFGKCFDGSLTVSDFDFNKFGTSERDTIGTVRRKISVLPNMVNLFSNKQIIAEENFVKNRITCSFATTDGLCTVGFMNTSKSRPKTLLKGNVLDQQKTRPVCLLLRKASGQKRFHELLIGDSKTFSTYYRFIKDYVDEALAATLLCNEAKELL